MRTVISLILVSLLSLSSFSTFAQKRPAVKRKKVVYKRSNKRVVVRKSLPGKSVVVVHRKKNYHFSSGRFYKSLNGTYTLIRSPRGIRIRTLPTRHVRIVFRKKPYFFAHGVFYIQTGNEYEVVDAPNGIVVDSIPEDAEIIEINGTEYYESDGTLFLAFTEDGSTKYKVHDTVD